MEQTENQTADLLIGIAKALKAEIAENPQYAATLSFTIASLLDAYELLTGSDA